LIFSSGPKYFALAARSSGPRDRSGLVLGRGQHGRPLLGVADAGKQLGLGEDFLQVGVLDELGVGLVRVLLDEEVLQVRPDERLIPADGRQEGLLLEARAEVGGETQEVLVRWIGRGM